MKKIKVIQLDGCSWCESLTSQLNDLKITYESIDANKNSDLADGLEDMLNTTYYPILILENPSVSYYLYRPSDIKYIGFNKLSDKITKIGCLTIPDFVTQIKQLL